MKISEAVALYITLRDKKAKMKADFEESVAGIQSKLDTLEAKLLEAFNKTGMDSVKTEHGTAYTTTRVSVTASDRDVFMNFVRDSGEWPLLEVRPSKTAVEQFRAANDNELPPGISIREERVVNVRRSA